MFRNQYDTDVTTFSPAGRLHQVEYATEAVKQGSCSVGLRTNKWAIIGSLKRTNADLATYQQKVFKIDSHIGMAISGLIADARVIGQYMRNECLNHRYVYSVGIQTERLVLKVSDKSQMYTQKAEKRPYGVGLLVCGYDATGPHLYQTDPSGVYFDCIAQAIGSRAQSAKTYLEKIYTAIDELDRDELIEHVLRALKGAHNKKLTSRNVAIGIVGINSQFTIIEGEALKHYVGRVTNEDDEDEEKDKKGGIEIEEKENEDEEKTNVDNNNNSMAANNNSNRNTNSESDAEEEKEAREAQEEQRREERQQGMED